MSYSKLFFILISIGTLTMSFFGTKPEEAPPPPAQTETPAAPVTPPAPMMPTVPSPDTPPVVSSQESTGSYENAFVKMLATLAGLLLLVFLTVWLLRRLTQGRIGAFGSQKKIKILERRPLSPKSILYLIEVGSKQVLVAESQLEIKALTTLHDVIETEEE